MSSPAFTRISTSAFESFPDDDIAGDPKAYLAAMDELEPGDIVTVFTPDDTHFAIAMEAVDRGLHVLIAKPIVKTLEEHLTLAEAARRSGVLVAMEVHKRWDPIYADARDRIRQLGDFSFFSSFMSQPKYQLQTFRSWAGRSSDISYYLNAHHIDFNVWSVVAHCPAAVGHGAGVDRRRQSRRASTPKIRSRSACNGKTSRAARWPRRSTRPAGSRRRATSTRSSGFTTSARRAKCKSIRPIAATRWRPTRAASRRPIRCS